MKRLIAGFLIGCSVGALSVAGLVLLRASSSVVNATCSGASVRISLADDHDGGGAVALVLVLDDEQRDWEARWSAQTDSPPLALRTDADYLGEGASYRVVLVGDADSPPERTIQVKPQGDDRWCDLQATI